MTPNEEALIRGAYFRSDHFSLARAGVPGTSLESGSDFVGRPAGWGKEQKDLYIGQAIPSAQRRAPAMVHL